MCPKILKRRAKKVSRHLTKKRNITSFSWFWRIIALIGFLIAIYSFWPRVNIYPSISLDPYNPFKQQFLIENKSKLKLKNITYYYNIPFMQLCNKTTFTNAHFLAPHKISNIEPNRKTTISIEQSLYLEKTNYESINLYIVVHYKYLCFNKKDSINFMARSTFDNKYIWIEQ